MKKLNLVFILIMIAMFSCVQQDDHDSSVDAKSVEKTLTNVNIDMSKYQNPISLEGNIRVWVNNNNELVAFTETETHVHLFVLQYLQNKINPKEDFKSITFLDHSFNLIAKSGKHILCEVKSKDESKMAGNDLMQIVGVSNYETVFGEGIVHIWLVKNEAGKTLPDLEYDQIKLNNSVFNFFEKQGDPIGTGCSSGGVGSTSCSINGCSVSCGAGYYACCNPATTFTGPKCFCVQN